MNAKDEMSHPPQAYHAPEHPPFLHLLRGNASQHDHYYFYEYDYDPSAIVQNELWTDECHDFEFSTLFLIVFALVCVSAVVFVAVVVKKRVLVNGFDALMMLILGCAIVKFTPRVWQSLLVHGHHVSVTQTGCKLAAFTTVGMTNVISYLVVGLVVYAYFARRVGLNVVDGVVRRQFAWVLLGLFALEGVTGMVPAIYTDIDEYFWECNATQSIHVSMGHYVAGHILLFAVIPYLLPFAVLLYPLIDLSRTAKTIDGDEVRTVISTICIVAWSYIATYFPYAVINLVLFPMLLSENDIDFVTACHFESVFQFVQDTWFVAVPYVIIFRDLELSRNLRVKAWVTDAWTQVRIKIAASNEATGSHVTANIDRVRLE